MARVSLTRSLFTLDKPSVKFGEALRDQVEERLTFFETGKPPSKNAEAIRKVLEAIALEDEDEEGSDEEEDGMKVDDSPRKDAAGFSILPLIEVSPPAEPSPKKKKGKKRKGDEMDVDREEEEEEEVPRKKVKLSKEEKKALKKELKRKRKEEEKAAGVRSFSFPFSGLGLFTPATGVPEEREERKERKEGKESRDGGSGGRNRDRKAGETQEREEREEEKDQGVVFMTLQVQPLYSHLRFPFFVYTFTTCFYTIQLCRYPGVVSALKLRRGR